MASLRQQLSNVYQGYLTGPQQSVRKSDAVAFEKRSANLSENFKTFHDTSVEMVPANSIQALIRPLFGKHDILEPSIGDHPDFSELSGTRQHVFCPITTMFMDIESSTRLSLIYELDQVYRIKNSFIRAAIEVIKSFDGHVHRIMGDAVMAYFGGKYVSPETGIINGLNCAAVLRYLTDRIVIPTLKNEYDDHFGIRIGLDFGAKDQVLWSSYGYPKMDEVTATSFYVDVASKLQHAARRNQIMLGQSLKSHIDFPSDLLDIKTVEIDGKKVAKPFLEPNHKDKNGKPIDYKQYELKWKDYLALTPIAERDAGFFGVASSLHGSLQIEVHDSKTHTSQSEIYYPCSRMLSKGKWLKYRINLPFLQPYHISFTVENHGTEAQTNGGDSLGNHATPYQVATQGDHSNLHNWEQASYRGLHYMKIDITTPTDRQSLKVGVYIA